MLQLTILAFDFLLTFGEETYYKNILRGEERGVSEVLTSLKKGMHKNVRREKHKNVRKKKRKNVRREGGGGQKLAKFTLSG